ncbi:hypothetical protein K474DRAFT_559276 [Panus rudis PR-1116 ss-1]|nr:hypothetical protein K474DRAFT_559276 [Panus rudis PR-1116 ss-1]
MRFSALPTLAALVAPFLVSAAPVKRTASANDMLVLQFAHVLEQLETQFYSQALQKFQESDFVSAGFAEAQVAIEQFTAIQTDEATHVTVLESTITSLGGTPISTCSFNFDSVLTDVATMAPVARVVENLGVAAYLGAAHLIDDPVLLTAAASILTVEARHQTILNIFNQGSAIPSAFDIPFTPSEVLAVASSFISGCDLGVPANPSLSITNTGAVAPGTALTFSSQAINGSTDGLFCQMLVGGAPFSISLPFNQCVVPDGINGPVAIFVTSDSQPLNNNVRDQATDKIVAGPTMAFIDTVKETIGQLARGSAASGSSGSSTATASTSATTTTISGAEASSIIASAAGSSAAAQPTATAGAGPTNNAAGGAGIAPAGGPNTFTGPVNGGAITVTGWSTVPSA